MGITVPDPGITVAEYVTGLPTRAKAGEVLIEIDVGTRPENSPSDPTIRAPSTYSPFQSTGCDPAASQTVGAGQSMAPTELPEPGTGPGSQVAPPSEVTSIAVFPVVI